jgi:pimeloyl-ACP methyl ester carboxylesterase
MLSALAGGRLLGVRYGSSPARVVALHGWQRSHADFDLVLEGLDAVAPDLPGFGATAPPPECWGAADYAGALAPVIEDEAPPVVVVGHSFGGRVATMLAAQRPQLVRALILSGVPLLRPPGTAPPAPALRYRVARALARAGVLSPARLEQQRQRYGSDDYRAASGVLRDVLVTVVGETNNGTYRDALTALACPVELVWGEDDVVAPPPVAVAAAALVRDARLTMLPGVGHLTPLEAPGALREAIERYQ